MSRFYYVYILTNHTNYVLYIGVTRNLQSRVLDHRRRRNPNSFCTRYNVKKLVYYEEYDSLMEAVDREKQLKAGSRKRKLKLIPSLNPMWSDLFNSLGR